MQCRLSQHQPPQQQYSELHRPTTDHSASGRAWYSQHCSTVHRETVQVPIAADHVPAIYRYLSAPQAVAAARPIRHEQGGPPRPSRTSQTRHARPPSIPQIPRSPLFSSCPIPRPTPFPRSHAMVATLGKNVRAFHGKIAFDRRRAPSRAPPRASTRASTRGSCERREDCACRVDDLRVRRL